LGVEPVLINASLVSAQSRKRLFWTNIPVEGLPTDRGILLKDILEPDGEVDERMTMKGKSYCLTATYKGATAKNTLERRQRTMVKIGHIGNGDAQANRVYSTDGKSCCLSANGGGLGAKTGLYDTGKIRKLTPIECERLQSLPDNYTEGIAMTHRYKCLGNAFNAEVVKFILSFIPVKMDPEILSS
jgi:DNA (cytosine-5)-methyltransferase 3A